jgi:hypothetical protein
MALAINKKSPIPPAIAVGYPHRFTAADITATTTVTAAGFGDLANIGCPGRLVFIAYVKVKASVGTQAFALRSPIIRLLTNRRIIDSAAPMTAAILGTLTLQGWSDELTTQYYRIFMTFGTSGTVDIEVNAMNIS